LAGGIHLYSRGDDDAPLLGLHADAQPGGEVCLVGPLALEQEGRAPQVGARLRPVAQGGLLDGEGAVIGQ
jgi:hypothetical protein